jgi:hypothetical protein
MSTIFGRNGYSIQAAPAGDAGVSVSVHSPSGKLMASSVYNTSRDLHDVIDDVIDNVVDKNTEGFFLGLSTTLTPENGAVTLWGETRDGQEEYKDVFEPQGLGDWCNQATEMIIPARVSYTTPRGAVIAMEETPGGALKTLTTPCGAVFSWQYFGDGGRKSAKALKNLLCRGSLNSYAWGKDGGWAEYDGQGRVALYTLPLEERGVAYTELVPAGDVIEWAQSAEKLNPRRFALKSCPWMGGPSLQTGRNRNGVPQVTLWDEGDAGPVDPHFGPKQHIRVNFDFTPKGVAVFWRAPRRIPLEMSEGYPVRGRALLSAKDFREKVRGIYEEGFYLQDLIGNSSLRITRHHWSVEDVHTSRMRIVEEAPTPGGLVEALEVFLGAWEAAA